MSDWENAPTVNDGWEDAPQEKNSVLKTIALENPLTAMGETALSLVSGIPQFIASGAAMAGTMAAGGFSEEDLDWAREQVPQWTKDITYEPKGEFGKATASALGEGFKAVGEGLAAPGAAVHATLSAGAKESFDDWVKDFSKSYKQVKPITRAAFDMTMAGKAAKAPYDMAKNFKQKREAKRIKEETERKTTEDKLIEETLAKQPQSSVTDIPNAPPVIPEPFVKQETPFAFDKDLRPPALPDQLKPLSEQYPQGIDIGTIEAGSPAIGKTTVPELPPTTRDLLSLVEKEDYPVTKQDYPIDYEAYRDTPNIPALGKHPSELLKQSEIDQAWNQKKAQDKAESASLRDESFSRYEAEQTPLRLEPEQASPIVEKMQGGISNRRTRNQSGAIDPNVLKESMAAFAHRMADITGDRSIIKQIIERGVISPEERTVMLNDAVKARTLGGTGKKGFGQGGAVRIEGLADFIARKKSEGTQASDQALTEVYYKLNPSQTTEHNVTEALSKVPGINKSLQKYSTKPVVEDPTGAQAVARIQEVGDLDMPKAQNAFAKNLLSQGRLQAWKSNSPIVHEGIGFITSVKDHFRIQAANTLNTVTSLLHDFEMSLPFVSKYSWKDAWEVIRTRRNNEFNPDYKPEDFFNGEKLELHKAIDTLMDDIHGKLNQRLHEMNPERETDLAKLPYYFTSFFRGDFTIPIFDSKTNKFLFNLRETTKHDANLAAKWISENNSDLRVGKVGTIHQNSKAGIALDRRGYSVVDFEQMMDILGKEDPLVQRALNSISAKQSAIAKSTADVPSRFMHKEGRIGSLGDKPWKSERENFIDSKKALEMYVEGANEWLGNTQISMFTKQLNQAKNINAPNAISMINDYANYTVGGKNANNGMLAEATNATLNAFGVSRSTASTAVRKWANANTALLIGWYSPRAMVQNVLQPIQSMPPRLQKLKFIEGVDGNISYAFIRGMYEGMRDIVDHWKGSDYYSSTRAFMEDNHVVDAHLVELGNMFGSAKLNALYDISANKSLAWTEQLSRSIAFNQLTIFFESAGYSRSAAMDMAKNITHETMVNYEASAKPQVFGGTGLLGETAGRLQTFKMNDLTQTLEYISDLKANNPKSWIPISTKIGTTILFAGVMGVIGMDVAELLWKGLQSIDELGENKWLSEHTLKGLIYENMPVWASKGVLSSSTGIDLSGSFSQQLVGEDPLQSIAPIAGTMYNQATGVGKLFSNKNQTLAQGLKAFAPSVSSAKIERELLSNPTDNGETQVVSPYTGKTVWRGKGQQMLGNLRSLERGNYAFDTREQKKFADNVNDGKAQVTKSVQQYTVNLYQNIQKGKPTDKDIENISKQLYRFYEFGGDPEVLWNDVEQQLESLAVGDEIVNQLRQEVTLSNQKVWMEAAKVQQRRSKK